MDIRDSVLLVLSIIVCLIAIKTYKNNNIEKFDQGQINLIRAEINNQYNMDIEAIRNLGAISKSILTGTNYHNTTPGEPGTLTIPADTIIEGNTIINGTVKFTNKNTMLMDILPSGMVIAWTKSDIPEGWLVCDGTNYTPDLSGRFILGAGEGANLTKRELDETSGAETHKLSIAELPEHVHKYKDRMDTEPWFNRDNNDYAFTNKGLVQVDTTSENNGLQNGDWQHWGKENGRGARKIWGKICDTEKTGNNVPHNNMPPFYVLIYIMKQ